MTYREWNDWLDNVPDEEMEGFERKAYAWAERYAGETRDPVMESCLLSVSGNRPRRWLDETYEIITCSCKSEEEAGTLLVRLYETIKDQE